MTTGPPLVSIVIPVLDPGQMLLGCLASFHANDDRVEVILVDNGSADRMVDEARLRYPGLRVIRNEKNRGFAVAADQGLIAATAERVVFLNSDALLSATALWSLVDLAESQTEVAIWQPIIVSPNGDVENAGEFFTKTGFFIRCRDLPPADADPYDVFAGTAACMLVRRDVALRLGAFTETYFAYIEDVDLCWRARLAGWDVRVVPAARVTHTKSSTTQRILEAHEIRYLTFRNRLRTILANASVVMLLRVLPVYIGACLVTAGALGISGRPRSAYAILRALMWPLRNARELRRERSRARALRVVPDAKVYPPELVTRFVSAEGWRLFREHYRRWDSASS